MALCFPSLFVLQREREIGRKFSQYIRQLLARFPCPSVFICRVHLQHVLTDKRYAHAPGSCPPRFMTGTFCDNQLGRARPLPNLFPAGFFAVEQHTGLEDSASDAANIENTGNQYHEAACHLPPRHQAVCQSYRHRGHG